MAHTASAALARKLSLGQEDMGDRPRSVLRALRLGIARAAGERLNLPLAVIGARQADLDPAVIGKTLGEDWLLLTLLGPEGIAAACLDLNCVSAIVQTQTIGEVTSDPPISRAFTDTDAAMTAPLIEDTLRRAVDLVEAADQLGLSGYEYASRAADLRVLTLGLVADSYRMFELTVELAGGLRQGQITVILPHLSAAHDAEHAVEAETGPRLAQSSGVVRAELNAVLCRLTLPLAQFSGLEPECLLPLTGARLDRTEMLTIELGRAAVGRLGQCGGMRAVRLNDSAPLPALTGTEAAEFIESRPSVASSDLNAAEMEVLTETMGTSSEPTEDDPIGTDLSLAAPDQVAAEISQLAGLDASEEGAI